MTAKLDDALSDADIEQRVRTAFDVIVPLLEHGPRGTTSPEPATRRAPRRLPLAIACGATVALGVAGGLAIIGRLDDETVGRTGSEPDHVGAPAVTGVGDSVASQPSAVPATTPDPTEDRAGQVQWFLPTTLPNGYELTDIAAELRVDGAPNPDFGGGVEIVNWPALAESTQTWIRRGADGLTNEDTISVTVQDMAGTEPAPTTSSATSAPRESRSPGATAAEGSMAADVSQASDSAMVAPANTTVHGVDAVIIGPPTRESPGWTVNWSESGLLVTLQATGGVSEDEAMSIAEATTVTPDGATIDSTALPTGFEPVETDTSPPPVDRRESVTLVADSSTQVSIGVSINAPATASLDALSIDETGRRTIDGVDYSLFENDDALYSRVVWVTEGRQFEAAGAASIDDVLTVATGLRTATRAEAAAAASAITAATQALPTVAAATLADDVRVSVHGPADGDVGICVDNPEPRCVRPAPFLGQLDIPGLAINSAVFHIDGDRRVIAWNGTQPELFDEPPLPDLVAATIGNWMVRRPAHPGRATPAGHPLPRRRRFVDRRQAHRRY